VAIGSILTGFSVTTLQPINGPITFALNDSTTFATASQETGVAEPSTFVMVLAAAAMLGASHQRDAPGPCSDKL
jgi:hypothetical protein